MSLRWTPTGFIPYSSDDEEDPDPTCDTCGNLDPNRIAGYMRHDDHYFSILGIKPSQISSQNGVCEFCTVLYESISRFRDWTVLKDEEACIHIMAYDDYRRPLFVWLTRAADAPFHARGPNELVMELYTEKGKPSPWPAIGASHHIFRDPTCDESFDQMSGWINDCRRNHPLCPPNSSPTLPARVIDVGGDDSPPKLYISKGEPGKYAALSHCWGKRPPFTTTKATIRSRVSGIRWKELPKTFQEAITITRRLGLKYLWIDSLCILQDDLKDWDIESSKMASIYSNSYVTIASTGFADSSGGLLAERQSYRFMLHAGDDYTICARQYLDHEQFAVEDFNREGQTWTNSLQYPLFKRGWCFQERILATRVLHFTPAGIFFECRCDAWCECRCDHRDRDIESFKWMFSKSIKDSANSGEDSFISGASTDNSEDEDDEWFNDGDTDEEEDGILDEDLSEVREEGERENDGDDEYEEDDSFTQWNKIVQNYTGKKLTYQSDVLPALSGIASAWQHLGMGKYLAGLWEHDLPAGLLWQSTEPIPEEASSPSKDKCLAPTFSWASRIGPIESFDTTRPHTMTLQILDADCKPASQNPYGAVTAGGFIKVRGSITKAKFHPDNCLGCADQLWQYLTPGCHVRKRGLEPEYFKIDRAGDAEGLKKGGTVYCLLVARVGVSPEEQSTMTTDEDGEEKSDQSWSEAEADEDEDGVSELSGSDDSSSGVDSDVDSNADSDGSSLVTDGPPYRSANLDDVELMRRKAAVSHSAVLILVHTGEQNRYRRIGASHEFSDRFFEDAMEEEIVII